MARNPEYYTRGKTEVWTFIREQGLNYHLGCAIKYIARAGHKPDNSARKDLEKAIHYLQNELEHLIMDGQSDERVSRSIWVAEQLGSTGDSSEFDR
jgi:hypothetical protein